MKSIGHAWVGLMALERLRSKASSRSFIGENFETYCLGKSFNQYYKRQAERFVMFFDEHKDAFVKGAWFPDSVIADNLTGGHTFKLKRPSNQAEEKEAKTIKNETPAHLSSSSLITKATRKREKVFTRRDYTLPDRCEALSHSIRDMILIQRKEKKGSDILFNDDMITLYFLMLGHYLADAHVPPHCDARDFYSPPTIHPDMEKYWDVEIKKFYEFDKKRKVFNYDIDGTPELIGKKKDSFINSFLYEVLKTLSKRKWDPADKKVLGKNNRNIYDYIKAVGFVSYLVSTEFIPEMDKREYKKIKILKDPEYKQKLRELSVHVLADIIDSIALVWLLSWDRYNKLKDEVKKKTREIKRKGGKILKS